MDYVVSTGGVTGSMRAAITYVGDITGVTWDVEDAMWCSKVCVWDIAGILWDATTSARSLCSLCQLLQPLCGTQQHLALSLTGEDNGKELRQKVRTKTKSRK